MRQKVLAAARETAAPGTSAASDGRGNEAEAVERMRRLVMVCEHERQHQETLCYMAAQQRKADAAAIAAGRAPVLAIPGANSTAGQHAGGILPFYLQQCSYASTSAALSASVVASKAQQGCPREPGTPARQAESLSKRLAALQVGGSSAGSNGGPDNGSGSFVSVPSGVVSVGALIVHSQCILWHRPET